MTFSIVAGHFESVVNPSQRTGVIGDFLKPVQCSSDLLPGYCDVCTLHLFSCVLLYLCISLIVLPFYMLAANIYKKINESSGNSFIINKYLMYELSVVEMHCG